MQERIDSLRRQKMLQEEEEKKARDKENIRRESEANANEVVNKHEVVKGRSYQELQHLLDTGKITELMRVIWNNYKISVLSDSLFAYLLPKRPAIKPPRFALERKDWWASDNSLYSMTLSTQLHLGKYREAVGSTFSMKIMVTKDELVFEIPIVASRYEDMEFGGFSEQLYNSEKKFTDFEELVSWIVEKIATGSPLNESARFTEKS